MAITTYFQGLIIGFVHLSDTESERNDEKKWFPRRLLVVVVLVFSSVIFVEFFFRMKRFLGFMRTSIHFEEKRNSSFAQILIAVK